MVMYDRYSPAWVHGLIKVRSYQDVGPWEQENGQFLFSCTSSFEAKYNLVVPRCNNNVKFFPLQNCYRKGKTTQKEWFWLCTVYQQPLLIAFSLTATFKMLQEQGERFIELREN